jgi:hypothetical protein
MSGLTTQQIAVRQRRPVSYVEEILADEQDRGHVELVGGRWEATERLVERYAGAFGYLGGPRVRDTKRGRS